MLALSKCFECAHFMDEEVGMCCAAYPEGIPDEILTASEKASWNGVCSKDYEFTMTTSQ